MVNIPFKVSVPLSKGTISSINQKRTAPLCKSSLHTLNAPNAAAQTPRPRPQQNSVPRQDNVPIQHTTQVAPAVAAINHQRIPDLKNSLKKGQKVALSMGTSLPLSVKARFGWNVRNPQCDIDVSVFLLNQSGKVPSDDWFVFYGQTESPDRSVSFATDATTLDREIITLDLSRLSKSITRIVFVLTINEAFEKSLNFSMIQDAYIRITTENANQTLLCFRIDEYYANVTSMTIGELYLHNNQWKFNPIGNGINKDLAGQCGVYGVNLA